MAFWELPLRTSGALQPALSTRPHTDGGVPQEGEYVPQCVGIRVVSYNFGIGQGMLESPKKWNHEHVRMARSLVQRYVATLTGCF